MKRVNINGLLNAETKDILVRGDESIKAQSTIALFKTLMRKYPQGNLYIILDNARYYRSKLLTAFVLANPRIKLLFLPP